MSLDPAHQIRALRHEADTRQACADFLDAASRLAADVGDVAESAGFALAAATWEESARLRTVRLLEVVRAHPDVEVLS